MAENKTILIVDDEPDIVKVTEFRLKKAGYEVFIATDGQKGLEMAAALKPGLIFLDLGLPVLGGKEVCEKLKADAALKDIPVIILSASSDMIKEIAEAAKADGFIIKPYEPQTLLDTVKKYL